MSLRYTLPIYDLISILHQNIKGLSTYGKIIFTMKLFNTNNKIIYFWGSKTHKSSLVGYAGDLNVLTPFEGMFW